MRKHEHRPSIGQPAIALEEKVPHIRIQQRHRCLYLGPEQKQLVRVLARVPVLCSEQRAVRLAAGVVAEVAGEVVAEERGLAWS